MFADLSLSTEAFARFLKYRICDLFVPDSAPFPYAARAGVAPAPHFLDGLKLTSVLLSVSDTTDEFGLNEPVGVPPSRVRPVSGERVLTVPRVAAAINGTLFVVAEAEIVRANFDPPARSSIPILGVTVLLRVYIDSGGTPRLQAQLVMPEGLGVSDQAKAVLAKLATFEQPLPLQSLLNNSLLGASTQILNVGMRLLPERVVIRVEYGLVELGAASHLQRLILWNDFFTKEPLAGLGQFDWALAMPAQPLIDVVAKQFDGQLRGQKDFVYDNDAAGTWFGGDPPGFLITAHGRFEDVCAGSDLRVTLKVFGSLSVPAPNTFRLALSVDMVKNAWDSFWCGFLFLANPFAPLITAADKGWAGFALAQFAPIGTVTVLALAAIQLGLDDALVQSKLTALATKIPLVIPRAGGSFTIEYVLDTFNDQTRDWIVIQNVTSVEDHIVTRGAFNVPEPNMPRLRAWLSEEFGKWRSKDRCNGNSPSIITARIGLALDASDGAPVQRPNVSLKYASGRAMEFVDDRDGIYRGLYDANAGSIDRYTDSDWAIPGGFEILVSNPPTSFVNNPYALQVRFYTSGGVRHFTIAPPPVPATLTREEIIQQAAEEASWRLTHCLIPTGLFFIVKALQVKWLPRPTPDARQAAQHWQVFLQGLKAGDTISAWDHTTGRRLGVYRAGDNGQLQLSMIMPTSRALSTMLLTLNEQEYLTEDAFDELLRNSSRVDAHPQSIKSVLVQQTELLDLGSIFFSQPIEHVRLLERQGSMMLESVSNSGRVYTHHPAGFLLVDQRTRHAFESSLIERKLDRRLALAVDDPHATAMQQYEKPPLAWFQRSALFESYFVQIDDGGRAVSIYRRRLEQMAAPTSYRSAETAEF